jgi:hypothetical protein
MVSLELQNAREMQNVDIVENFSDLDGDLLAHYGLDRQFDITIVGSGALIMLGVVSSSRRTTDIDVFEASPEIVAFFEPYQMNTLVTTFYYLSPETWKERRQKLAFSGDCLTVYTLSLEDLVILKLLAFRKRDQDDLVDIVQSRTLDWEQLDKLIATPTEVRVNLESEDAWLEFTDHYAWLLEMKQRHE